MTNNYFSNIIVKLHRLDVQVHVFIIIIKEVMPLKKLSQYMGVTYMEYVYKLLNNQET